SPHRAGPAWPPRAPPPPRTAAPAPPRAPPPPTCTPPPDPSTRASSLPRLGVALEELPGLLEHVGGADGVEAAAHGPELRAAEAAGAVGADGGLGAGQARVEVQRGGGRGGAAAQAAGPVGQRGVRRRERRQVGDAEDAAAVGADDAVAVAVHLEHA